jgi:hypothetical protein
VQEVPWAGLVPLLQDSWEGGAPSVTQHALGLVQNLCKGGAALAQVCVFAVSNMLLVFGRRGCAARAPWPPRSLQSLSAHGCCKTGARR